MAFNIMQTESSIKTVSLSATLSTSQLEMLSVWENEENKCFEHLLFVYVVTELMRWKRCEKETHLNRLILQWFIGIVNILQCDAVKLSFVDVCYTVIFATLR